MPAWNKMKFSFNGQDKPGLMIHIHLLCDIGIRTLKRRTMIVYNLLNHTQTFLVDF